MPDVNTRLSSNLTIEILAVAFSITYTVLITYGINWCWPAAIIGSVLFLFLCFKKQLFAETILHLFYIATGVYGWITWETNSEFITESLGWNYNIIIILIGIAASIVAGKLLKRFTSSHLPFVDSFTTIFGFVATLMMIHMVVENWIYWIVIDTVSIYLYSSRGMHIAALLYFAYTLLAINGYYTWVG